MSALPVRVAPSPPDLARVGPGGSAWWYADLTDGLGNGMVLIVASGLPFLPGYTSAARRGERPDPHAASAVVLSTLRAGRPDFYAFHHVGRIEAESDAWRWEGSAVRFSWSGDRFRFAADLHGVLPGCRWNAEIEIEGMARRAAAGDRDEAAHEWTVLTAGAVGTAVVRAGHEVTRSSGRAYVDRNLSIGPLQGAWHWGHAGSEGAETVWYSDGADGFTLVIQPDGTTAKRSPPHATGLRIGRWGLERPARVAADGLDVALSRAVDDGPFYTRVLLGDRGAAVGFAEVCDTARVDRAWSRPLVRMVVAEGGSRWLPLFSGPRRGRIGRLLRHGTRGVA